MQYAIMVGSAFDTLEIVDEDCARDALVEGIQVFEVSPIESID